MTEPVVLLHSEGGIATITLNRPESRNALNIAMCNELIASTSRVCNDQTIRLAIFRANGPAFCAGADLKERQGMDENAVRARRMKAFAAYNAIERLPMPSVAIVTGPAIGSGCEIAAACDFIIATRTATFRTPEALWGTVGATQRLPRIIGKRLAKDMMFSGRTLDAEEARAAGLVSRIVAAETLETSLAVLAKAIVAAPPEAMQLAKRSIDQGVELDPRGALATELLAIEENLARGNWRARIDTFGSAS